MERFIDERDFYVEERTLELRSLNFVGEIEKECNSQKSVSVVSCYVLVDTRDLN